VETGDVLIDAFGRIRHVVHQVCEGLDAGTLAFRPDPDANSIAWLVWHLTRVQDDHVSEIAGIEQAWPEWAAAFGMEPDVSNTGYGHTSEQVGAIRPPGPEPLLGYLDAVYERTVEYCSGVDAAELGRIIDDSYDPPVSVGVRLVSVIEDDLQHAGQAGYVRGLAERSGGPGS
jgi:hypothetical protein